MRRLRAAAAACSLAAAQTLFAGVPPPTPLSGFEGGLSIRAFFPIGRFNPALEFETRSEIDGRRYLAGSLGSYWRAHENLKVGLFYRKQYGVRHDTDWVKGDTPGTWSWREVNFRGEDVLIADVTPRMLLTDRLVGELKGRYELNTYEVLQTITLRPGLNYFWLREGEPFLNLTLQWEAYLPLNYGDSFLYEHWTYLGALFALNRTVQLGATLAYRHISWGTTRAFLADFPVHYQAHADTWIVGGNLVLRLN